MRFALVAAALVAVMPSPARACSPPMCWGGAFLPADGSTVPANLPGIIWQPMQVFSNNGDADPAGIELRDDAGNQIALTATVQNNGTYLLVPASKLVPGTHYNLVDATQCKGFDGTDYSDEYPAPHSSFTAAAEAPLPGSLGDTLVVSEGIGPISQGTSNGSCSVEISADRASLMLELAPTALPWKDLFVFRTSVDGQQWSADSSINQITPPGQSWTGRATDRVYSRCADADGSQFAGLSTGSHIGLFGASLPGTTVSLTAGPASFALDCGTTMVPDPGGDDVPNPSPDDGGGCSTGAGTGGASLLVLLALGRRRSR